MAVDLLWQIWCENEAFNHSSKLGGWMLHFLTSLNRHDCHQSKNMKTNLSDKLDVGFLKFSTQNPFFIVLL